MVRIQYSNETNTVVMSQETARDVANFIRGYEAGVSEDKKMPKGYSPIQESAYKEGVSKRNFSDEAKVLWESIGIQNTYGCSELPKDNQKFVLAVKAKIKELIDIEL